MSVGISVCSGLSRCAKGVPCLVPENEMAERMGSVATFAYDCAPDLGAYRNDSRARNCPAGDADIARSVPRARANYDLYGREAMVMRWRQCGRSNEGNDQ